MAIDKRAFRGDIWAPSNEGKSYDKGAVLHRLDYLLFAHLGVDRQLSERGRDENGSLRFYELTEAGELKDPFADGSTLGSDAFLNKASKGRILAFPAGEKQPVQLQVHNNDIGFSKPMETLPIPQPQEPQRLSRWARFANAITFGRAYRAEKAEYQQKLETYQKDMQNWQKNQDSFRQKAEERTPELLEKEAKQLAATEVRREEAEKQAKLEADRTKTREQVKAMESGEVAYGIDQYRSLYQSYCAPKPERRENLVGEGKYFTEEQFGALKTYELPRGEGLHGTEITDKEVAALSVLNASDKEISGTFEMNEPGVIDDKTGLPKAEAHLYSPEENVVAQTMMFTESMIDKKDAPRKNMGKVFGALYQPSREKVNEAIREYRQEDKPEKLAGIIAGGLHFALHRFEGKGIGDQRNLTSVALAAETAAILDRDPRLKEAVLSLEDTSELTGGTGKKLVTEQDLKTARGYGKMVELHRRNEKAETMLHADTLGVVTLTDQQRQEYTRDRVNFETVAFASQNDIDTAHADKTYEKEKDELSFKYFEASAKEKACGNGYYNARNNGENTQQQYQEYLQAHNKSLIAFQKMNIYDTLHIGPPETVKMVGAYGDKALDGLVDAHLPGAEKLASLKGEELEAALTGKKLFAKDSPYTQKPEPEKQAPEKQKTVEKAHAEPTKDQGVGL